MSCGWAIRGFQTTPTEAAGDDPLAELTPLRSANSLVPILHASVSCKWTIRSDRSQNARTEGLNLVRNRKGPTPHIVVVVGEPLPARIASIAFGTGDIDCVYHFPTGTEGVCRGVGSGVAERTDRWPTPPGHQRPTLRFGSLRLRWHQRGRGPLRFGQVGDRTSSAAKRSNPRSCQPSPA